jgi:Ca2+-dependent lipid-binding protein
MEIMQNPHKPDLELMLGGELTVTVLGASGLHGDPRMTNPFVVLRAGSEVLQSSIMFETLDPVWNHQNTFRKVLPLSDDLEVRLHPQRSPFLKSPP